MRALQWTTRYFRGEGLQATTPKDVDCGNSNESLQTFERLFVPQFGG